MNFNFATCVFSRIFETGSITKNYAVAAQVVPGESAQSINAFNYGIGVDSQDKIWFNQFNLGKIVRLDPLTEKFMEYQVPGISTPRGLAIDSEDNVWFANF